MRIWRKGDEHDDECPAGALVVVGNCTCGKDEFLARSVRSRPLPYYRCGNCGAEYSYGHDFGPKIPNFWERHSEGDMVGAGECEACRALTFPIEAMERITDLSAKQINFLTQVMGEEMEQGVGEGEALLRAVNRWNAAQRRAAKRAEKRSG